MSKEHLWTDAKIKALTVLAANTVDPQARWMHEQIAKDMRNDYERALASRNEQISRLQGELRNMQARIAGLENELTIERLHNHELAAAIDGCAGQWTPMPEGAHYCGCSEEDCPGEWRIENNGSRLVIGDGESELSVEFYEAIRVCWQVQPSINAEP